MHNRASYTCTRLLYSGPPVDTYPPLIPCLAVGTTYILWPLAVVNWAQLFYLKKSLYLIVSSEKMN
jgi:hypothetical protein